MKRIISRSLWRKLAVTVIAILGFVLLYEVAMFDSRDASRQGAVDPTAPQAGSRLLFSATAYCKGHTTASGAKVRTGIAASDPSILPVGSVINVTSDEAKYNGIYTIMDTGPKVQGRILDVYMWSCNEALVFGRKQVQVTVLRLGWNPTNSTASLVDRLFRRREAVRAAPLPAPDSARVGDGATVNEGGSEGANGATVQADAAPSHPAPSDAPLAPSAPFAPIAPVLPASAGPVP